MVSLTSLAIATPPLGKGALKFSTGAEEPRTLHAGEQFRNNVNEIKKLPPDAPELKLSD